jgi:hypothetical protein
MTTEPVPGGDAGVPPSGVCEGAIINRAMGKIGEAENAIIDKNIGDYTFPLTPPDGLGLDDWNGGFVQFWVECPTGETQYVEPIENPIVYEMIETPATRVVLSATFENSDQIICDTGENLGGATTFTTIVGALDYSFPFVGYSPASPSSVNVDCVCGGGSSVLIPLCVTVISATGQTETQCIDIQTGGTGCFGGIGNFFAISQVRQRSYFVSGTS